MGRWGPDASGRLQAAALDLYVERGFEQTTVADIAERAGLTARTFFRYFADKREVLFAGSTHLEAELVRALADAPAAASPIDAVAAAVEAVSLVIGANHTRARQRQSVISGHDELRERELLKMESWAAALADGLQLRGADELPARLAAEAGIAALRVAFERWVGAPRDLGLVQVVREVIDELRLVTGPASSSGRTRRSAPAQRARRR
jgi:AcrR family transcriptional regulator